MFKESSLIVFAGILLGCLQLSHADTCDEYVACVKSYRIQALHGTDAVTHLNVTALPDNLVDRCPLFFPPVRENCEPKYPGCDLKEDWNHRLEGAAYVHFLVQLGFHICQHLSETYALKSCYTATLEENLMTCQSESKTYFDLNCLRSIYDKVNRCEEVADETFHTWVDDIFPQNPYQP